MFTFHRKIYVLILTVLVVQTYKIQAQTKCTTLMSGIHSNCTIWDNCPGLNVAFGDTIFINHDVVSTGNLNVSGVLYIGASGTYTGNSTIKIMETGKMFNVGNIDITKEFHNDGEVYNNGYLGAKNVHDDGYTCNTGTIEVDADQEYDCHGCTIECGGTLIACTIDMHENGGILPFLSESNVCCADGSEPEVHLYDGSIDSATVTFCSVSLPIELLSFSAEHVNDKISVNWSTITESNNEKFRLWKSSNGFDYSLVQEFEEVGTSTIVNHYDYEDYFPFQGTSYYQLSQIDFDGNEYFYNPVAVSLEVSNTISLFPNPFLDEINIEIETEIQVPIKVTLFTLTGQLIDVWELRNRNGSRSNTINMSNVSSGTYLARIDLSDGNQLFKKLIKK